MFPKQGRVLIILLLGVVGVSTAAIFIRLCLQVTGESGLGFSLFIAAVRLTFASVALLPVLINQFPIPVSRQGYQYAIGAGMTLMFHFAFWITSLSFTSIAASTTIVTTNPIWVTLLSWFWLKEKPTRFTILGIGISLLGGFCIAIGDAGSLSGGTNPLLGDALALLGAWSASFYLLLGKQAQASGLSIGHYSAIAYSTAAILLLPLPLFFGINYWGYPREVYVYLLGMALFSQVLGHTSFNWAVRFISPTFVTLALLFEPVSASILGFFVFGEVPSILVLIGAIILLTGSAIAILGADSQRNIN
ncbi:DMT family transporter [Euhalothece natronophila Z-M001]|uniref:DMT family transporter n=1 Tax=Euhalothece natronophila Z-M001 TaxID=522448 RepID=A0A5B8NST2_9CHRO|nr:DMT family transporter [Euhalothece natronophila]QDZ41090.1 DMT family transporter [Euhalothece natronophila Z-M001]